jgi:ParB/RepB/Spo0J family partition protein
MKSVKGKKDMKETIFREIPIDLLIPHPARPNRMSKPAFARLVASIKNTGFYEPVVVRAVGEKYQIINGYHRVQALLKLDVKTARAIVCELDDLMTLTLLASLNRLKGTDQPQKKKLLYKELLTKSSAGDLSKNIPASATQIQRLAADELPQSPALPTVMPEAVVFFLNPEQRKIVQSALASARRKYVTGTTAQQNAAAITMIANSFQMEMFNSSTSITKKSER